MRRGVALAGAAVATVLAAGALQAQGSALDQHSACMSGRVGAGVAAPCDDGSAVYFNPAALAEQVDNPYYTSWAKHKPGTTVTVEQIQSVGGGALQITTTIDPKAQKAAYKGLTELNAKGAVVALDPRNGKVLALASTPSYDPGTISGTDDGAAWRPAE